MTSDPDNTFEVVCVQLQKLSETKARITPDTILTEEFNLDSIKVLDMLMEIEDHFDISIPMNVMADVHTVKNLVDAIDHLRK